MTKDSEKVCGHWYRELVFLSESDYDEFKKTGQDEVTGGKCPDCKKELNSPDPNWYPRETYKKEVEKRKKKD